MTIGFESTKLSCAYCQQRIRIGYRKDRGRVGKHLLPKKGRRDND